MADDASTCSPPQQPKGLQTLWKYEDWMAVWVGFFIIALALVLNQYKVIDMTKVTPNYKWATDGQITDRAAKWNGSIDPLIADAKAKEEMGTANRLAALT